jgi:hypothetical protein
MVGFQRIDCSDRGTPGARRRAVRTSSKRPGKSSRSAADDPNRLIRQTDGAYRTTDERFGVAQANGSWFLTDQQTADDFGQPRVTGPFATLKAVRDAIPEARAAPTSIRKPIPQTKPSAKTKAAAPPPKPKTWLDRLTPAERRRAQRMMNALEEIGLPDAEDVARSRMEGKRDRKLAARILRARLDRLLAEADEAGRRLVADAVRLLTADGERIGRDLPGWALVETDASGSPTDRRIDVD